VALISALIMTLVTMQWHSCMPTKSWSRSGELQSCMLLVRARHRRPTPKSTYQQVRLRRMWHFQHQRLDIPHLSCRRRW
jgi:hypothetical protein